MPKLWDSTCSRVSVSNTSIKLRLTALLVVLPDLSIRNGIEVPIINGDTLARLLSAEPPDLLETSRLVLCRRGGRCQETEREHEQSTAGALD